MQPVYDDEEPEAPPAEYRTFSFKCRVGTDDDLIEVLDGRRNRSNFIRRKLRLALRMPDPMTSEVLTVDDLRTELDRIIDVIQNTTFVEVGQVTASEPKRQDVNDNGTRIPRF